MYIIEGNIGAGKSTLLRLLGQYLQNVNISLEPTDKWQDKIYGQSLLTNFYQQPKRWAYTFETLTLMSRINEHLVEKKDENKISIVERSIFSGYYCFAQNSYEQGFMTGLEWTLYQEWFNFFVNDSNLYPKGFIYLRTSPEVAHQRIKIRNRYAEKTISMGYLKQIHQKHENFLVAKEDVLPEIQSIPVLILDCDVEFEANKQKLTEHINAIREFCLLHNTRSHIRPLSSGISGNINSQV
jgi:deoxyadenosine/deoxycytidine kinase